MSLSYRFIAPPGCLDDLLNMNQLRRMWESRAAPVLYSSPQRELTLNCNNTGYLSKVLVGVYDETGVADLQFSRARHPLCNHSTFHATEQFNVFECILNPPIEIDENDSLYIEQRYSSKRIAFLHDGQMDTPLISLNLSEYAFQSRQNSICIASCIIEIPFAWNWPCACRAR